MLRLLDARHGRTARQSSGIVQGFTLTLGKTQLESAARGNFSQRVAENLLIRKVFEGDRVALNSNPAAGNLGSALWAIATWFDDNMMSLGNPVV